MSTDVETPPLYVDSATLKEHYGLGQSEIEAAWRALPTYRIGDRRKIRVRRDELEDWIEGYRRTPEDR